MLIILTLSLIAICLIAVLQFHVLRKQVSNLESPVRTPRDLGALVLIERIGQCADEAHNGTVRPPAHCNAEKLTNSQPRPHPLPGPSLPTAKSVSSSDSRDPYAAIEAAVQGAWFGKAPLENLREIDENVYVAMSALAGKQLNSIGELSDYLSGWESADMGEMLPEGALNKLMGHLAEPIVGQHLEDLGIQVEMPVLSNQAGYDLVLNGAHAVNVKTVTDFTSLTDHFDKFPKIPVVVPGDMANAPADAIYLDTAESIEQLNQEIALGNEEIVLVDGALTNAGSVEHAEGVSDAVLGNVDAIGVPFITIALSGLREVRLLAKQETDVRNAIKNLGLDVLGTGGGASAGVAIGGTIGTLVPGVGTAIGALSGGILGAIAGRKGTNRLKYRRLRKAIKKRAESQREACRKVGALQRQVHQRYRRGVQEQQDILTSTVEARKREQMDKCKELIQRRRTVFRIDSTQAQKLLEATLADLSSQARREQRILTLSAWLPKMLRSNSRILLQQRVAGLKDLIRRLESEAEAILGRASGQTLVGDCATSFLQLLLSVDGETRKIIRLIRVIEKRRQTHEAQWRRTILEARQAVADRRHQCFERLAGLIRALQKEVSRDIDLIRQELEQSAELVRVECARD